jgi:serine/threonine-protein kinase HipA
MPRCPITYKKLQTTPYSRAGLRSFSNKITELHPVDLDFTSNRETDSNPENKKCFARLVIKECRFITGDKNDRYIFIDDNNPAQQNNFNRDLTLKLTRLSGIKTVVHGLAYNKDGGMFFWYKRPQFYGRHAVLPIEYFSGLLEENNLPLGENLSVLLKSHCTFPALEKLKLLRLALFSFLTGNNSINLTDLAIIKKKETTEIAPINNLTNTAIYLDDKERQQIKFLGQEIIISSIEDARAFSTKTLGVNPKAFNQVLKEFDLIYLKWLKLIEISFLKSPIKKDYLDLLRHRRKIFFKF